MPTIAEVPQSVGADSVFKAVVKIPYKNDLKEIGADGSEVPLQVGAVVMLPDGFKLAPQERWTEEIKEETEGVYFTNYSEDKDNIIIVGPLPGDTNKEIVFPVLSPDPSTNKEYHYGKYSLHIGGNRGRGQVYPTGDKSNNVVFTSSTAGTINSIETIEDGSYQVNIENDNGEITTEAVPVGPQLIVKAQDKINAGDPLTNDPNVGTALDVKMDWNYIEDALGADHPALKQYELIFEILVINKAEKDDGSYFGPGNRLRRFAMSQKIP